MTCRSPQSLRRTTHRRGIILVLVLWIAVLLSLLAYSVLYQMSLESRVTSLRARQLEANTLARAGIAKAFTDLKNDMIFDNSDAMNPPFDAEGDIWAKPEEGKDAMPLGNGEFSVQVIDHESLFNINRFRPNNKLLLEKIIEQIGYTEEDSRIVASAILDYMDEDDVPSLDSAPAATEGMAYGILRAEDLDLSTRERDIEEVMFADEPFLTVEALLDVYGVTPELFFGPETPEAEYYRAQLGPLQGEMFEIETRRRRRDPDSPIVGLRDFFTVHGSEVLNVNTAPKHVLQALFEAAGRTDSERAADNVIRQRRANRKHDFDNDRAFKSSGDLQASAEIGAYMGPMMAMYPMGVNSTVFTVRSTGRVGATRHTIEATVSRRLGEFQRDEDFEKMERAKEREQLYEDRRRRQRDRDSENIARIPLVRVMEWKE